MRTLRNLLLGAVLAGALLIRYSEPGTLSEAIKSPPQRKPAPDFTLQDAKGSGVRLSDYNGKVVLLDFWATWCAPCKIEIPWFVEFEKTYHDRGFAVIGVSMDDDGWKAVTPYAAKSNINYKVLLGTEALADKYGGLDSLPTTLTLDRHGRIAAEHAGLNGKSVYEDEIKSLLTE